MNDSRIEAVAEGGTNEVPLIHEVDCRKGEDE